MQRICELRIKLGYTQEFLGQLIGCERRNISRYESGLRQPDIETLVLLAEALHTTTDYLLNRSNNSSADSHSNSKVKTNHSGKGENFMAFDRLISKIIDTKNPTVMGLDPKLEYIPDYLKEEAYAINGKTLEGAADAIFHFNKILIDAVYDIIPAVKPQAAYYEMYGWQGVRVLAKTIAYAQSKGLFVIVDGKRGDIGSTMEAYAEGWLGSTQVGGISFTPFGGDALTVNGYLGTDGIEPLINVCKKQNKGIFVLAKTSNPSSGELQDIKINDKTVYETMAMLCDKWGENLPGKHGYNGVGVVVGATYPEQLTELRQKFPKLFFLVPGYGAQGGSGASIAGAFDKNGLGAVVNASRSLMCAWQKAPELTLAQATRAEAIRMRDDISSV